ncbi:MAG: hypothetical protein ACOC47_02865 [Alkalispirochaetaceae bacterium]
MSSYEIRVLGHLDPDWNRSMFALKVSPEGGAEKAATIISGSLPDQAALQAVVDRLIALNLTITSIRRLEGASLRGTRNKEQSDA